MRTLAECTKYITDKGITHVLGIDEVGLGAIAGDFVMASCLMPVGVTFEGLRDSKKTSAKCREALVPTIKSEFYHHIAVTPVAQLNATGILWAKTALASDLIRHFQHSNPREIVNSSVIVFDGIDTMATGHINAIALVKADNLVPAVMAAANIAKQYRDNHMQQLHVSYPMYHWDRNMGYPTQEHLKALAEHGVCPMHRKTYKPVYMRL